MSSILFWDFFGPDAEGTAQHFRRHLEQFLEREAIEGAAIHLESAGVGHHAVACRPPAEAVATIVARLRPRRQQVARE